MFTVMYQRNYIFNQGDVVVDDYQKNFEQYRNALLNDEHFTGTLAAARKTTHNYLLQLIQKNGLLLGSTLLCALGGFLFGVFGSSFYDLSPENTVYQIIRLVLIAGFSVSFYFSHKLHKKHFSKLSRDVYYSYVYPRIIEDHITKERQHLTQEQLRQILLTLDRLEYEVDDYQNQKNRKDSSARMETMCYFVPKLIANLKAYQDTNKTYSRYADDMKECYALYAKIHDELRDQEGFLDAAL